MVDSWNLPTCKEWLEAYGYGDDEKFVDLRHKISQLNSNNEYPSKLLNNKSCRVIDINQCVWILLPMVSCVASRSICINKTPYEMEREVKLCLTNFHNVDMTMNKENDKDYNPYWL